MILDNQSIFSDNQAITSDCASTNVLKYQGELANATPVELVLQITQAFKAAEVTSVSVKIQTDSDDTFASPTVLLTETLSAITKGTKANFKFMPKGNEGYIRIYYDLTFETGVSAATAGKITCGVTLGVDESFN